jgi:uncharacterized membrane protein YbhN (UPF0104 family)
MSEAVDPFVRRRAVLAFVPGLLLLAGLVWLVIVHFSEERQVALLLERSRPWWLAVAALLQAGTYVSVGETWRIPLTAAGYPYRRRALAGLVLVKLTLDQAVPTGGLSGTVFMISELRRRGVPSDVLGATMLIVMTGYYLAYAVGVAGALAVLGLYHDLTVLIVAPATVFAVLAAGVPLVLVRIVRRGRWRPPRWLGRFPWVRHLLSESALASPDLLRQKRLIFGAAAGSFITMLLDSLTLAVTLLAVGARPNLLTCFAALVMASVAATIGLMPGGLGTFEAGSVAVLTLTGTNAINALSATMLLRGFTFWLPMVPGLVLASRMRRRHSAPRITPTRASAR